MLNKNQILDMKLLPGQTVLFYLGQVGFLIKSSSKYILVDAYLDDYVDRNCSSELVKWVRRYPAPISASELDFVDYVFCTHSHYDHADPDTLSAIAKVNSKAKFFVPAPIKEIIASYGIGSDRITGLDVDKEYKIDDNVSVKSIPAAHETIHRTDDGNCLEVGYIIDVDGTKIYHSGDCCPYRGLEERICGVDVAIMPINGRDYFRTEIKDIIGCFDSNEAVTIAKDCNIGFLIPVHFDLYDVNCVNPAYFVDCLNRINPTQRYHIFAPGEPYIFVKY